MAKSKYPGIDEDLASGDSTYSEYTQETATTGWTAVTTGLETILKGNDVNYVRQKYGFCSIIMSIALILYLTTSMSMCGVAPFGVNPAIGPYPDGLSGSGAKNAYFVVEEYQYWRFLTAPFMSVGIIHLLCTVGILLETGAFFEREWGSINWLIVLATSSIGATLYSCIFSPDTVSVMSSATVVGLFGAKCSTLILTVGTDLLSGDGNINEELDMGTVINIVCSFAFTMMLAIFPYVDFSGHLGGFMTGFFVGMILLTRSVRAPPMVKLVWMFLGVGLSLITIIHGIVSLVTLEPDGELGFPCYYFDNIHSEGYECTCSVN